MTQEVTNFARFYTALRRLPQVADREELKCHLVRQYTAGRTESLREMSRTEYAALCKAIEQENGSRDELRHLRSQCLRQMQQLGIDTTDWTRINSFCLDPRIAGKVFGRLSPDELTSLSVKLRLIHRKGGLRPQPKPEPKKATNYYIIVER